MPLWNAPLATQAEVDAAIAAAAAAQATADAHSSRHSLGGADPISIANLGDYNAMTSNTTISTIVPRMLAVPMSPATTFAYGAISKARVSTTVTGVRFFQRAASTGMTYLFAGIYNADATVLLGQTANLAALDGSSVLYEAVLTAPVAITAGTTYVFAIGGVFTGSPSFNGAVQSTTTIVNSGGVNICYRSEINEVTVAGLPNDLSSASGRNLAPWMEGTV